MKFEWDPSKAKNNLKKHNLSFSEAKFVFFGTRVTWQDNRKKYGETRYITIGTIGLPVIVVVVYTLRKDKIRIISARLAKPKERKIYHENLQKTSQ